MIKQIYERRVAHEVFPWKRTKKNLNYALNPIQDGGGGALCPPGKLSKVSHNLEGFSLSDYLALKCFLVVAIAAVEKAVNFTRSLSTMVSKSFLSTISSRFGDVLTLTIYLQIFCEFKTLFFSGKKAESFRQETSMAWHGLFLCGRSSLI